MIKHIDELDSIKLGKNNGVYERMETRLMKHLLKSGDKFVDVGAHIGYYTDMAAEIVGETGKVWAFEPEPGNFKLLTDNTKHYKNVERFNCGLGEFPGELPLYVSEKNTGDHRCYETVDDVRQTIEVDLRKLDACIGEEKVNFMKIDVQGFETKVLRGAAHTIENSPDIQMLIEYTPFLLEFAGHNPMAMIQLLTGWGFSIYTKRDRGWVYADDETYYCKKKKYFTNLFCSRKKIDEINWSTK